MRNPKTRGMTDNRVAAFDALSNLPECVLHGIMSFLSEQDASRMAFVSKLLNHAWVTSSITDIESPSSVNNRNCHLKLINLALKRHISRLDKRRFCTTIDLQKLRVHAMFCSRNYSAKINRLVSLALDNRVEEIDLCHIECSDFFHELYQLSGDSFSGRPVRVIKIKNFDLEAWDFDSVTAQTEELILNMCSGLKTIHINKESSLKVVDIQNCSELRTISFDSSTSLQSLTLHGDIKDVMLKDFRSLKNLNLQLSGFKLNDVSLAHILSQCPVLEALTLTGCGDVQTISFYSSTLKKIDLIQCEGLQRIQISAKSLQSFKFYMMKPNQCEIDIKQCESIRYVHLCHSNIDDKWMEETLWKLCWLEDLSIESCFLLTKVKLPNERIKSLSLWGCPHLKKVEISSPLLESYRFTSQFYPRHKFLHSSHKVRVTLSLRVTCHELDGFRDFLGQFHLCEELTLEWWSIKDWDFPRSLREIPSYPLYPLKHLRIIFYKYPTRNIDLLNKILWIALRPEKISLVFNSRGITRGTTSIEFQYSEIALQEENQLCCCRGLPFKCWKHSLITLKLKNMRVDRTTRVMLNYFIKNAPTLRTIYVDSHFFHVIEGKLDNKYDQLLLTG